MGAQKMSAQGPNLGHQPGITNPNVSSRGGGKFQCPTESNRSVDDNDKYFFIQSEHFED